jgi:Peptidase family C25
MDDKIIVSNRTALTAKYGSAGLARIKQAIAALVTADAARGITSRLVFLDDDAVMRRFRGRAVTSFDNPRQNKEAIDAIFRTAHPEYLMILGAPDVVPHQDMKNPAFDPPGDPDENAEGDLPYACDEPYSRDIAAFKGPTRVVGRVPDLKKANEPAHLLKLISVAEKHRSRPVVDYGEYFGLSTRTWRKSTALSLFNAFGNSNGLTLAPPKGPGHPAKRLAPLAHFINCHGGSSDPAFYGERGNSQPKSLTSKTIASRIKPGTVAAVECCYGAELYDSVTPSLPIPICQHYLAQGAFGYFGSSTIAYGPEEGNGAADLITQYFLMAVLDGASLGRAALQARQRFVQQTAELDPVDLKTLAQFNLLGDPSVHPAAVASATSIPRGIDVAESKRQARRERRAKLCATGEFLKQTKPTASRKARKVHKSATVRAALANIARAAGIAPRKEFTAFEVKAPKGARPRNSKATPVASRYYVAVYRSGKKAGANGGGVAAVAKEVSGRIVGYRIYRER